MCKIENNTHMFLESYNENFQGFCLFKFQISTIEIDNWSAWIDIKNIM